MAESLEALMQRYVDGDARAFDALYELLAPAMRASLRRWLRTDDRVDDAFQQAVLKMHNARARYRRGAPVMPWALTIARNVAMDRLRTKKREAPLDAEAAESIPAPEESGWSEADENEVVAAVREAVETLPPSLREVVRLHKIEGKAMAEVAAELGIKEGAARVRAHRGYKALAVALAEFWARSAR